MVVKVLNCSLNFHRLLDILVYWVIYRFFMLLFLQCLFAWCLCEKYSPHVLHWYGFSPVWIRICLRKSAFRYVEYGHALQNQFFLFSWTASLCFFLENHISHICKVHHVKVHHVHHCEPYLCVSLNLHSF